MIPTVYVLGKASTVRSAPALGTVGWNSRFSLFSVVMLRDEITLIVLKDVYVFFGWGVGS